MSSPSQVESIFFAALEKNGGAERAAYLDQACGGDSALRLRLERLLDAYPQAQDFLAQPAVDRDDFEAHDGAGKPTNLDSTIGPEASSADPRARIEMAE